MVIPVLNEGERLLAQLARMRPFQTWADVVIADAPSTDGSTDPGRLGELDVQATVSLTERGGLSASLRAAFSHVLDTGYEGLILMDGNGRDDPGAIPRFIAAIDDGHDYVHGSRWLPGGGAPSTPSVGRS